MRLWKRFCVWLKVQYMKAYTKRLCYQYGIDPKDVKVRLLHDGEVVSSSQLDDGRDVELYVEHGEYKCRVQPRDTVKVAVCDNRKHRDLGNFEYLSADLTPRQVFQARGFDFSDLHFIHLNGEIVEPEDYDKSLNALPINRTGRNYLIFMHNLYL